MLALMVQNHPHRTGPDLRREFVRRLACHGSTFSRVGASGNPGAVQSAALDLSAVADALAVPAAIPEGWRLVQCLENQDLTYASHSDAARVAMLADASDRRSWYARSRSR